jgi:hypothetical protein
MPTSCARRHSSFPPPPNRSFAINRKCQKPGQGGQKCYFIIEFIHFLFVNTLLNICKQIIDHLIERLRLLGCPFSNKKSNSGGSIGGSIGEVFEKGVEEAVEGVAEGAVEGVFEGAVEGAVEEVLEEAADKVLQEALEKCWRSI